MRDYASELAAPAPRPIRSRLWARRGGPALFGLAVLAWLAWTWREGGDAGPALALSLLAVPACLFAGWRQRVNERLVREGDVVEARITSVRRWLRHGLYGTLEYQWGGERRELDVRLQNAETAELKSVHLLFDPQKPWRFAVYEDTDIVAGR